MSILIQGSHRTTYPLVTTTNTDVTVIGVVELVDGAGQNFTITTNVTSDDLTVIRKSVLHVITTRSGASVFADAAIWSEYGNPASSAILTGVAATSSGFNILCIGLAGTNLGFQATVESFPPILAADV